MMYVVYIKNKRHTDKLLERQIHVAFAEICSYFLYSKVYNIFLPFVNPSGQNSARPNRICFGQSREGTEYIQGKLHSHRV